METLLRVLLNILSMQEYIFSPASWNKKTPPTFLVVEVLWPNTLGHFSLNVLIIICSLAIKAFAKKGGIIVSQEKDRCI